MSVPCQDIIEDIEDLISSQDITPKERYSTRKNITIRSKRKQIIEEVPQPPILNSIVPGTQTIYVKTWGCTHNNSDSEYMAGQLATYGYKLTENKYEADLWLLNSCTVKNPAEDHFRNEIEAGKKIGKHVVVAGYEYYLIFTNCTSFLYYLLQA
ncbi:Threonylcarbamoyladenosine tRNA methylthiotransferase [Eufriesea mexicana]|nr:Threonylcarbamoyladenosine tRNA methylthiotransferase [Eufriesea mexicana]